MENPLVLHLTQAMQRRFQIPEVTQQRVETHPHLQWCAHFFIAQRLQCILTTNVASRYSIFMYKSGLRDDGEYIEAFLRQLGEHMDKMNMGLVYDRVIAPRTGAITISKTFDRSVIGAMNGMVQYIKYDADLAEMSPWDVSKALNSLPVKALKWATPEERFPGLSLR